MSEVVYGGAEPLELEALAVYSHPDDAELTCGGTLLKLKSLGRRTGVVDVTRGEMGTRGTPEQRFEEAREAARIMRLDVRVNLEQPDGHVFVTDEARTALVRVIRAYRPKVILTAHWDDPHPDHAATARLAREAARLASMRRYDESEGQGAVQMPALAHAAYSRPPSSWTSPSSSRRSSAPSSPTARSSTTPAPKSPSRASARRASSNSSKRAGATPAPSSTSPRA